MSKGTIITENGEVIENAIYYTEEEIKQIQRYKKNKEKIDYISPKDKMFFKRFITGFNKIDDLSCQEATRLMYLSTYVSYDNNILKYDNGITFKRKDLKKVLNLGDTAFKNFLSEMKNKKYIIETDNGYQISKDIVKKGETLKSQTNHEDRYVKIYIMAMRKMYLSVSSRQHKFLGYVFQMLPYVNIYHNILCYNPYEKSEEHLDYINMIRFCEILGLSLDNVTQFRKNAEKVVFEFNGTLQHFMCYILGAEDESKNQGMIIINPNILYGENEINRQDALTTFYKKDTDLSKRLRQS